MDTNSCFYCRSKDVILCPDCGLVAFCGEKCRKIHRLAFFYQLKEFVIIIYIFNRPYDQCLPFTIENRGYKGNVVVAVRDIKPFETIIIDRPAIIGPFDDTLPQCLECYKEVDVNGYKVRHNELYSNIYNCQCRKCNLPLCGPECENGKNHAPECAILSKCSPLISVDDQNSFHPVYSSVAIIRMLSVKDNDPDTWKMVDNLMDHLDQRRSESKWDFVRENVLPLIVDRCGYDCEQDVIERIIGIFRTNSVKWEKKFEDDQMWRPVGHALCPLFSVLCHSCINNTRYTQTQSGDMIVRAVVNIRAGDEITTQYRGPNTGNILRRPDFPTNWMFQCDCMRCVDPTELGTHASTIRCPGCSQPTMLPVSSDMDSVWQCGKCPQLQLTMDQVKDIVTRLEFELDTFSYASSPEEWEELLEKFQSVLHDNHYICMKTKRILLQIYGARDGYRLNQLTREQLDRKIFLCKNYIEIFSKLEPGFRTWKGRLLEELLGPLTMTMHQDQEGGKMAKVEYLMKYKEIMKMLREAAQCRQFDERNDKTDERIGQYYQTWMKPLQSAIAS